MRKKTKRTILIFTAAFLIVLGVYTAMDLFSRSDAKTYESNWHISIPCDLKNNTAPGRKTTFSATGTSIRFIPAPKGSSCPFLTAHTAGKIQSCRKK
jgi:hypothetical protein